MWGRTAAPYSGRRGHHHGKARAFPDERESRSVPQVHRAGAGADPASQISSGFLFDAFSLREPVSTSLENPLPLVVFVRLHRPGRLLIAMGIVPVVLRRIAV